MYVNCVLKNLSSLLPPNSGLNLESYPLSMLARMDETLLCAGVAVVFSIQFPLSITIQNNKQLNP